MTSALAGMVPDQRRIPIQDAAKLMLLAERWNRASAAHDIWARGAKRSFDFFEGRQWTEEALGRMNAIGRPALTFNHVNSVVRLLLGFFANNKIDPRILPGYDGTGTEQVAEILTRVLKQVSERSRMPYVDTEVFMDGLVGGRGFFDTRLNFDSNVLGEVRCKSSDPFATYLDPDGSSYDINETCAYVIRTAWTSPDEVEHVFGREAASLIRPLAAGSIPTSPLTTMRAENGEITPVRYFGADRGDGYGTQWWDTYQSLLGDYVDPLRKNIRAAEFQYQVTEAKRVFVDLETGDTSMVPEHWDAPQVAKALWFAEQAGNPMEIAVRPVKRVRWTVVIGDLFVHDDWSPYRSYTLTPYFSYFRRGFTRGMVDDLIDPQQEVNKRRSAQVEMVTRSNHGGWKYHADALDPQEEARLKRFGAQPGFNIKWKGDREPTRVEAAAPPAAMDRLEMKAIDDIRSISGVNESALGENDNAKSGRAIEARQRQAVVGAQTYFDNFSRSKDLQTAVALEVVQDYYREQRVFRILGEDGKFTTTVINQQIADPVTGAVTKLNDITLGKYSVAIDEQPMAATYATAQFEEITAMIDKLGAMNPAAIPAVMDIWIDASTVPRKDELKQRLQQAMGMVVSQPMPQQPATPDTALSRPPGAPPALPLPIPTPAA